MEENKKNYILDHERIQYSEKKLGEKWIIWQKVEFLSLKKKKQSIVFAVDENSKNVKN